MRLSIGQRIAFGFLIALTTLLVVGGAAYRNLQELTEQRQWVLHTLEVLQKNERLFSRISDSSDLVRGYALTGDDSIRLRFESTVRDVGVEVDALRALTTDNPLEQQRLQQLETYIAQRQDTARTLMALRRGANTADRDAKIAAMVLQGAQVMDQIRNITSQVEVEERRLLQERRLRADAVEHLATATLLYGTGLAFLLVGMAAFFITRSIRAPLTTLIEGATRIGDGDYAHRVVVATQDEIGQLATVFNAMARQIEQRQASLAAQDWLNANLAKFSRIFEEQRVQAALCQSILVELATVLNARHSVLYVPQVTERGVTLNLQASYACENVPQKLAPGEGLAGQCFADRQLLVLSEVPRDYLKINSALGAATPSSVVIFPAIAGGEVKAVIELASFSPLQEVQRTFLLKLGESIGVVLNSLAAVKRTEELLTQAQALSERLQLGQQQLNERNHELEVQTERLQSSEQLLQDQQAELKQTNEELEQSNEELQQTNTEMEEKTVLLEEQKTAVELANRDVSEARTALEEKVRQLALSSKYKSEFLANMSHELRTPLNSLLILSKVLADNAEATLTAKQVERANAINASGNDLLELINDILDLAKIEAGSVELEVQDADVSDLTQQLESTFRHMAESKKLKFSIDISRDTPKQIVTDSRRLQQVLKNLLANACKFTERGSVTLTVTAASAGWQQPHAALDNAARVIAFAVRDTGIGIAPDRQHVIFEAFQQADAGTSRKYGGTGLGLSISRELARLLGGALTLQSEPGMGSTFTLFVPLVVTQTTSDLRSDASVAHTRLQSAHTRIAAARAAREELSATTEEGEASNNDVSKAAQVNDDRNSIKAGQQVLLVIEDDKHFANILADFARDKGFKVLLAHTAEAGIQLARRYRPTAITLDLLLPDNDGWVVLDRIKHDADTRHIPLHVISVDEQRERSLRLGAVSYLQKPATAESIQRTLSQTLEFVNRAVKNLLIVEDDARQRQSVLELIGNGDVHATAVASGKEALQALEHEKFDCLVIDLGLPDMTGVALIEEIQRRYREASPPIIVYTGKSLTRKEETELRRISEAVVIKDVSSPERLLAETALFLHRVQAKLPESKRRLIEMTKKDDPLLANRNVLVVDDDVRNIFAITAALESHKMTVLNAETGKAGIELLQAKTDIDIVLMDVMMPEMDGYEAIRRIRADTRLKKLPIIAVTAKAMKGDRERCLQAGASDYITKPVDMDQLRSLLRVWLYR